MLRFSSVTPPLISHANSSNRFGTLFVKGRKPDEVQDALSDYPYVDRLEVTPSRVNPDDTAVIGHKAFNQTAGDHLSEKFGENDVHVPWCKDWPEEKIRDYIEKNPPF